MCTLFAIANEIKAKCGNHKFKRKFNSMDYHTKFALLVMMI